MIPGSWYPYFYSYQSPPTITMTTDNDFVLCGKATVNGISKLNIARFDKTGKASWSRNYESVHNLSPENIHQQGTGFLIMGETDIVQFGICLICKRVFDESGRQRTDREQWNGGLPAGERPFSASPGSIQEVSVEPRQANDMSGTSWKPVNIISQDIEAYADISLYTKSVRRRRGESETTGGWMFDKRHARLFLTGCGNL